MVNDSFPDKFLFLFDSLDPLYGDVLVYLETQCFLPHIYHDERHCIRHQDRNYIIVYNTLYCRGVDLIIIFFLIHEEVERFLNDFHAGACGRHLSGIITSQKILRVGYFWPTLFKDCMNMVHKFHSYQIFTYNMHTHLSPLHIMVTVDPFSNWGIYFMTR